MLVASARDYSARLMCLGRAIDRASAAFYGCEQLESMTRPHEFNCYFQHYALSIIMPTSCSANVSYPNIPLPREHTIRQSLIY
jgi:hypothetical protein